LLDTLDMVHGLKEIQRRARMRALDQPLWSWSRTTAWRRVVAVMQQADIAAGPYRVPKGLRHGYAIHAFNTGVPRNMFSKWMGHSLMEMTAIYANAVGEEQQAIAARMWS
jgi:integrase